jgi:hypothetical protein
MPTADRRCGTCSWRIALRCGAYTPQERKASDLIVNAMSSCRYWVSDLTNAKCELCVYWEKSDTGRCHKLVALIQITDPAFWCGEFVPKKEPTQ